MTVELGDIVPVGMAGSGQLRWVVSGFVHNPQGPRMAKLIRKTKFNSFSSWQVNPDMLVTAERPVFNPGDKVKVDGNRGVYRDRIGDVARIMMAVNRRVFTEIGFIETGVCLALVSYGLLVLENRKV
ncbi:hypothetical protein [Mesorhizobium caraganae]|uniref:hypothetical protein n=1 Tax=Mesorhizobium caraganae TaxID=483206 RepID=UPI00177D1111|nr:hypothetical protein [Mesorhizobium caraganae]